MIWSGPNKLIRSAIPAPRYSAVSSSTRAASGAVSARSMSAASADSSPPARSPGAPRRAVPLQDGLGPDVGLQAAQRTAAALPAADHDRGVAPLGAGRGPGPFGRAVPDDRGADAGADQAAPAVPAPLARAEPQLGLAQGVRAVLDEQRQVGAGPQQPLQRHRVPAVGLREPQRLRPRVYPAPPPAG